MIRLSRGTVIYALVSLVAAFICVYYLNVQPTNTDSYYHYNAAVRLAEDDGFVDDYLWTYIGAPDSLPAPSHLYWMPGTSLIAATGMVIFGTGYRAAQVGLALCLWVAALLAYAVGWRLGKTARHAWLGGLLTIFSPFFLPWWGQTDTFAPYAAFGGLALWSIGQAISSEKRPALWWLLAGGLAGASHLIRSDGLILLLVGWAVLLWPFDRERYGKRLLWIVPFTIGYMLVMSPWFMRNLNVIGAPLAAGGTQAIWYTEYNDLFAYPPDASFETFMESGGIRLFLETRAWAYFSNNGLLLTFVAVQGMIVFAPFILIGLWQRWRDSFLRGVWIFALGIHLAFGLVFPFPGVRGGLFHAAAALIPFWGVIGILGLEEAIDWMARRRRTWHPRSAKLVFTTGFTIIILAIAVSRFQAGQTMSYPNGTLLSEQIEPDARVMLADPSEYYYYTGRSAVVIPNESPEIALQIAEQYDVDYLLLEDNAIPNPMQFDVPPDFLIAIPFDSPGARLYAFDRD